MKLTSLIELTFEKSERVVVRHRRVGVLLEDPASNEPTAEGEREKLPIGEVTEPAQERCEEDI